MPWITETPQIQKKDFTTGWNPETLGANITYSNQKTLKFNFPTHNLRPPQRAYYKTSFTQGRHVMAFLWSSDQRRFPFAHARIGLAMLQEDPSFNSCLGIGEDWRSMGLDLIQHKLFYNNRILGTYPKGDMQERQIPSLLYMFMDFDEGRLGFGSNTEYFGTAFNFSRIQKTPGIGAKWTPVISVSGMDGRLMSFYKGSGYNYYYYFNMILSQNQHLRLVQGIVPDMKSPYYCVYYILTAFSIVDLYFFAVSSPGNPLLKTGGCSSSKQIDKNTSMKCNSESKICSRKLCDIQCDKYGSVPCKEHQVNDNTCAKQQAEKSSLDLCLSVNRLTGSKVQKAICSWKDGILNESVPMSVKRGCSSNLLMSGELYCANPVDVQMELKDTSLDNMYLGSSGAIKDSQDERL